MTIRNASEPPPAKRKPGRPKSDLLACSSDATRISFFLPPDTVKLLRMATAQYDLSRSLVAVRAFREALDEEGIFLSDLPASRRKRKPKAA